MTDTAARLKKCLNRPLNIGNRTIQTRLALAPMSKLGTAAFRELVDGFGGCGLLFSEMTGARSVPCGRGHHASGFVWRDEELPRLICQLFDDNPDILAEAARRVADEGFFGVDLNFGCAVAGICKRNCGAAILKQPELAVRIVSTVRKAVSIPLTVKYRTGWSDDPDFAVEMARRFEEAGADALTFHPRVAPDRRTRPPKWEYIGRVKAAAGIPVFGNGNVFDAEDCRKMLETTGCDGVALGRLALARPWIFSEWTGGFQADAEIYYRTPLKLIDLLAEHAGLEIALRRFLKFSYYYASNFRFGHTLFSMIHRAKNLDELKEKIHRFFENPPEIVSRPNITLLR